jgi:hypothetical protein
MNIVEQKLAVDAKRIMNLRHAKRGELGVKTRFATPT